MSCFCALDKKKARRKIEQRDSIEDQERLLSLARRSKMPPLPTDGQSARSAAYRVIVQDFMGCVEDEVTVRRGECVRELFRDGDWVFVATNGGQNGFVPSSYCRPVASLVSRSASMSRVPAYQHGLPVRTFTSPTTYQTDFYSSRQQLWPARGNPDGEELDSDRSASLGRLGSHGDLTDCRKWLEVQPPQSRASVASAPSVPSRIVRPPPPRRSDSLRGSVASRSTPQQVPASLDVSTWAAGAGSHVRMVYRFDGNSPQELSVGKGEVLAVLRPEQNWLFVRTRTGKQGYIPECLTQPVERTRRALNSRQWIDSKTALSSSSSVSSASGSITDGDSAISTGEDETLSTTSSRSAGSTSTSISDDLFLVSDVTPAKRPSDSHDSDHDDGDKASSDDRDAVTPVPKEVPAKVGLANRPRLQMLFDYTGLIDGELDVEAGDIVFENPDKSKPGWAWVTRSKTGLQGFVPVAFTHPHGTQLDDRLVTAL